MGADGAGAVGVWLTAVMPLLPDGLAVRVCAGQPLLVSMALPAGKYKEEGIVGWESRGVLIEGGREGSRYRGKWRHGGKQRGRGGDGGKHIQGRMEGGREAEREEGGREGSREGGGGMEGNRYRGEWREGGREAEREEGEGSRYNGEGLVLS